MTSIKVKLFRKIVETFSGHGIGNIGAVKKSKLYAVKQMKKNYAEIQGHKMYLDTLFEPISVTGVWEPLQTEYIKNNVKEGDYVIDLGAHIGYFTLILSEHVGSAGKVFAFEPNPKNFSLLKKNVELNNLKNIQLSQKAVSDKEEKIKLFLSDNNSGDNRIFDIKDHTKSIDVESVVLDNYLKNELNKINFIKMDIQGAEVKALRGMLSILEKNKSLKIISEFWPFGINGAGDNPEEYLDIFSRFNFKMYRINHVKKKIESLKISELNVEEFSDKNYEENLLFVKE